MSEQKKKNKKVCKTVEPESISVKSKLSLFAAVMESGMTRLVRRSNDFDRASAEGGGSFVLNRLLSVSKPSPTPTGGGFVRDRADRADRIGRI